MVAIPTVVHCKRDKYTVLIDRSTKWGNPFSHKENSLAKFKCKTLAESIELHERWLKQQRHLMAALPELVGQTLGCWCKPNPCHGDTLAKFVGLYLVRDRLEMNIVSCRDLTTIHVHPEYYGIVMDTGRYQYFHRLSSDIDEEAVAMTMDAMVKHMLHGGYINTFFWERL